MPPEVPTPGLPQNFGWLPPQLAEFTTIAIDLDLTPSYILPPQFDEPLTANVRETRLLAQSPFVKTIGKLDLTVTTEGWKFPSPPIEYAPRAGNAKQESVRPVGRRVVDLPTLPDGQPMPDGLKPRIRTGPTADHVLIKDRLLYLLQPPLDGLFNGRQLEVPFEPFPYQLEGIAFLMPRHAALLADEMGLGKTAQAILALRLLYHQGVVTKALIVMPKPLVHNWARELKLWAPDLPFEVFDGDADDRRRVWLVSNCPLKLINYETLTRDS